MTRRTPSTSNRYVTKASSTGAVAIHTYNNMSSNRSVNIVGAGVFGLSTALHLLKRGYTNVTVFDAQPFDVNGYDPNQGCDGASADLNKIFRASYGHETEYQNLAYSGRKVWLEWNDLVKTIPKEDLPAGLKNEDQLFYPCGFMRLCDTDKLSAYDIDCLNALESAGLRDFQHVIKDPEDRERLAKLDKEEPGSHWMTKFNAFSNLQNGTLNGFLDSSAGLTFASGACAFAQYLCRKAGVRFVLGPQSGTFDSFIESPTDAHKKILGIKTVDGMEHLADLTVVAAGAWTAGILPTANQLVEATAGSVVTIQLPKDRQDLWDRFSPEKLPAWAYGLTGHESSEYGGLYGFPRTSSGVLKVGYRGRKWTNYRRHPKTGAPISTPRTKYTNEKATNLPRKAIENVKRCVGDIFPELKSIPITDTRMCWYTDSIDNNFVIDYVPDTDSTLFICTGGSGHGFKFLPVLGDRVVDVIEGKTNEFTKLWQWRTDSPLAGEHKNGLLEGESGDRVLDKLEFATKEDWLWSGAGEDVIAAAAKNLALQ